MRTLIIFTIQLGVLVLLAKIVYKMLIPKSIRYTIRKFCLLSYSTTKSLVLAIRDDFEEEDDEELGDNVIEFKNKVK